MFIAGILVLPALADRTEVRPEAFSLFFFALTIITLFQWYEKKFSTRTTAIILSITGILWVNIHIFFFLQFLVIGAFGLQALFSREWKRVQEVAVLGTVSLISVFINPLGLTGVLYPFKIFGEYGYSVGENQTPYFFLKHYTRPYNVFLVVLFLITAVSAVHMFLKTKKKNAALLIIFLVLLIFVNSMIRFANFFGLVSCIVLAFSSHYIIVQFKKKMKNVLDNTVYLSITSLLGFVAIVFVLTSGLFFPITFSTGWGLHDRMQKSADFYKKLSITGPIFNNFDIGGYLIYHLYPQKVYIDNRPEAYPADFIQEYVDIQVTREHWHEIDDRYKFGAIYFSLLERTYWGQTFLVSTYKDPDWVPVFTDDYAIIFVRNIPEHAEIIEKYRIPAEFFRIADPE